VPGAHDIAHGTDWRPPDTIAFYAHTNASRSLHIDNDGLRRSGMCASRAGHYTIASTHIAENETVEDITAVIPAWQFCRKTRACALFADLHITHGRSETYVVSASVFLPFWTIRAPESFRRTPPDRVYSLRILHSGTFHGDRHVLTTERDWLRSTTFTSVLFTTYYTRHAANNKYPFAHITRC